MRIFMRDAEMADMEHLQDVFKRASMSNENDRGPLLEHPEWFVLSEKAVKEGRMRVAVEGHDPVVGFATYLVSDGVAELEDLFVDPAVGAAWNRQGARAGPFGTIASVWIRCAASDCQPPRNGVL